MAEKPINMTAVDVKAILDGRKSQTRRVLKGAPTEGTWHCDRVGPTGFQWTAEYGSPRMPFTPPYAVGDLLWVRENLKQRPLGNFLTGEPTNAIVAAYAADDEDVVEEAGFNLCPWWKGKGGLPSIHMPRFVSRISLKVTAVKVERLNDISDDDCEAEGIESDLWDMCAVYRDYMGTKDDWFYTWPGAFMDDGFRYCECKDIQRKSYRSLWESIHGPSSWGQNPWVVAISFERLPPQGDST